MAYLLLSETARHISMKLRQPRRMLIRFNHGVRSVVALTLSGQVDVRQQLHRFASIV